MGKYLQNTFLILRFSTHKNKKTNIQRNAFNFLVVYDLLCMNCAMFAQNKSCSISVVGFPTDMYLGVSRSKWVGEPDYISDENEY